MKKKKTRSLKWKLRRKVIFDDIHCSSHGLSEVNREHIHATQRTSKELSQKSKKLLNMPKDVLLGALIPFISYWDLEDFLNALHFSPSGIYILMMRMAIAREKCTETEYDVDDYCGTYEERKLDGVLHCEHSPAYVYRNLSGYSIKKWYLKGKLHRRNGPAVRIKDPDNGWVKKYYINDQLHRDDGPAWDAEFAPPRWYRNGVLCAPLVR